MESAGHSLAVPEASRLQPLNNSDWNAFCRWAKPAMYSMLGKKRSYGGLSG